MGTRADFYVGRGETAEWIGSIAWDGYPEGIDHLVKIAKTEEEFRAAVAHFGSNLDDFTRPEMGWPWPWKNSRLTDYAYAFDGDRVFGCAYGHFWFEATAEQPDLDEELKDVPRFDGHPTDDPARIVFPDMTAIQKVDIGKRSGVIFGIGGT